MITLADLIALSQEGADVNITTEKDLPGGYSVVRIKIGDILIEQESIGVVDSESLARNLVLRLLEFGAKDPSKDQ